MPRLCFHLACATLLLALAPACRDRAGAPNQWHVVAVGGLALRQTPGENGRVISTLPYGASVKLLGETKERDANGVRWLEVAHGDLRGWASGDLLNTAPVDQARIAAREFKGLILFSPPSNLHHQGGHLLGSVNGKEYGVSHYRHINADVLLLEQKLRYVGDRVEWKVVDALVIDPAPKTLVGFSGDMVGSCRDAAGTAISMIGEPAPGGNRNGGVLEQSVIRAWRIDESKERFHPLAPAGLLCSTPVGDEP